MDTHLGAQIFVDALSRHWLSAFFLSCTLTTILVLFGARWWLKRRWQRLLEEKFDEENELDILTPIGPADQQALDLIKTFRQEIWDLPDAELQLSTEALTHRAARIVRSVGAVYNPEAGEPQYEASLLEILQMIRRVSTRLSRVAAIVPFKFLADRKLSDYQRYYQVYRKINESPILRLLKNKPHLYRAARWAMNVKNLGNPLYWAGKELSREGYFYLLRWFYLTFASQMGREAMRLYSGRHFQTEEDRDGVLVSHRLFALTRHWGGPSADEWALLVELVSGHPVLESEVKLHILSRWAQDRLPKDLDQQRLQTRSGAKWYRQGLKRLLEKDPHTIPYKKQLIEREMASLETRV